jgi:hypothetical protein
MGTSDGYIVGTTKIVDHGPANARWNMVVLSEGYQASELSQYHDDCQRFVDHLYATAPFHDLWCGVNVFRVDVVSTDSGADDPATCGDGTSGTGATPATYFDASFCTNSTRRLLAGNETTALNVSHAQVPEGHVTMVLVNSPQYGGAGGGVAWFSTNASSAEIGIHEMGHTFFGFIDEYGDVINTYTGPEPSQPNATKDTNRATTKWHDLIAATTALPTTSNPNCSTEDTRPSPVAAGVVGLFEGAGRAHCGLYRAEYDCRMRHLGVAFCAVCQRRIRALLAPFVPSTTVVLDTPSVSFGGVPEGIGGLGVTTYRAIVFDVTGCGPVTLRITAGPTGGFGTPLGTSTSVAPDEYAAIAKGRLWLSYTSTTAGSTSNGTVTVQCPETGQSWVINISAHTIARPKSAVVLVLDHSGSMSEDSGDGTPKVDKLKQAVSTFAGLMLTGDGVGVVRFDNTIQRLLDITDVGPLTPVTPGSGRDQVNQIVAGNQLDPAGATSIGGGVAEGKATLDSAPAIVPPWAVKAMVVVTDGVENTPPMIADVASSITANTFAIGIGLPSNISVPALDALTQNHHGYLLVTGTITTDASFRLTKYFLQVLAGVTNANVVIDPQGQLTIGSEHRIPYQLCEADYGFDAIVLCETPELLDVSLEAPDGTQIAGPVANVQTTLLQGAVLYRAALPALPAQPTGTHGGTWQLVLRVNRKKADSREAKAILRNAIGGLPYSALVHCYSNLVLEATLRQTRYDPSAEARLNATLNEYGVPVDRRAKVAAEITAPDGSMSLIALTENAPGSFDATFSATQPGVYTARVRASGTDFGGIPFTREQTLTASVWIGPGGGDGGGEPNCDRLWRLLCCLLDRRTLTPNAIAKLEELGVDVRRLEKCVSHACRDDEGNVRSG